MCFVFAAYSIAHLCHANISSFQNGSAHHCHQAQSWNTFLFLDFSPSTQNPTNIPEIIFIFNTLRRNIKQ